MDQTYEAIARRIDHALLTPTMTTDELAQGCEMAARYNVATVCTKPFAVAMAAKLLLGTEVGVGTVIGFPHGSVTTATKVFEVRRALDDGAIELDMVINIGQAMGGEWSAVHDDIASVTAAGHQARAVVKVIFETSYLNPEQIVRLCQISGEVGADYVKTSTGFGGRGASREDLILMRESSPPPVKVKASGGIRDLETAIAFVELGCERLGLSKDSGDPRRLETTTRSSADRRRFPWNVERTGRVLSRTRDLDQAPTCLIL